MSQIARAFSYISTPQASPRHQRNGSKSPNLGGSFRNLLSSKSTFQVTFSSSYLDKVKSNYKFERDLSAWMEKMAEYLNGFQVATVPSAVYKVIDPDSSNRLTFVVYQMIQPKHFHVFYLGSKLYAFFFPYLIDQESEETVERDILTLKLLPKIFMSRSTTSDSFKLLEAEVTRGTVSGGQDLAASATKWVQITNISCLREPSLMFFSLGLKRADSRFLCHRETGMVGTISDISHPGINWNRIKAKLAIDSLGQEIRHITVLKNTLTKGYLAIDAETGQVSMANKDSIEILNREDLIILDDHSYIHPTSVVEEAKRCPKKKLLSSGTSSPMSASGKKLSSSGRSTPVSASGKIISESFGGFKLDIPTTPTSSSSSEEEPT